MQEGNILIWIHQNLTFQHSFHPLYLVSHVPHWSRFQFCYIVVTFLQHSLHIQSCIASTAHAWKLLCFLASPEKHWWCLRVSPLNPGLGLKWTCAVFEWQSTYANTNTEVITWILGGNIVEFASLIPLKNITYCAEQRGPLSLVLSHNHRLHEKESLIIGEGMGRGWGGGERTQKINVPWFLQPGICKAPQ